MSETKRAWDPFAGTTDTYDKAKFYTRASNKFDHSHTVHVPIPKDMLALANQWVQNEQIPEYRSVQDVMRDAMVHRLQDLADRHGDYEAQGIIALERVVSRREQARARRDVQMEFCRDMEKELRDLALDEEWDELEVTCDEVEASLEGFDAKYRLKLERLLEEARLTTERRRGK